MGWCTGLFVHLRPTLHPGLHFCIICTSSREGMPLQQTCAQQWHFTSGRCVKKAQCFWTLSSMALT